MIFLGAFMNVGVFSYVVIPAKSVGVPIFVGVLLQLVLTLSVCIALFRYKIIREDDKILEYENSKDTSLSNYWYISDKDNMDEIEQVPIFEFSDGNYMIAIRFSYGNFNRKAADSTRELFQYYYTEILKQGFAVQSVDLPERFEESLECRNFLGDISRIDDDKVSVVMRDIATNLLGVCGNYNSLVSTVFLIKTVTPVTYINYKIVINKMMSEFSKIDHSIRSISALNNVTIRSFMRDYYGLEALDLANLKTARVDSDLLFRYKDLVKIGELALSSGEIKTINLTNTPNKAKRIFK